MQLFNYILGFLLFNLSNDPFTNLRFAICVTIAVVVTALYTCASVNSTTYGPSNETLKYWPKISELLNMDKNPTPFSLVDPVCF